MKKLFAMLFSVAIATTAVSCDPAELLDDIIPSEKDGKTEYVGEMSVSIKGVTTYTNEDAHVYAASNSTSADIFLEGMRFDEKMPVQVDILVSDVEMDGDNFFSESVIPTVKGIEMPKYTLTDVSGSIQDGEITVNFVCMGFNVEFEGTTKE